ncbi:hypothetical protein FJZ17_01190 [Candidatus Pacearchaeota archaeon]|nr:hypothetical protein [Candidatus Pacearchaeota archaeon]
MSYRAKKIDTKELAREFRVDKIELLLEESKAEENFYPGVDEESERELCFQILQLGEKSSALIYWGHVLISKGIVKFYNLFPGQEPRAPKSYTENTAFLKRTGLIVRAIEELVLTGR